MDFKFFEDRVELKFLFLEFISNILSFMLIKFLAIIDILINIAKFIIKLYNKENKKYISSGQGVNPYRRYSPRALVKQIRCNSEADSIVWMKEGNLLEILIFNIFNYLSIGPDVFYIRVFIFTES
jgi:hypothetical protein